MAVIHDTISEPTEKKRRKPRQQIAKAQTDDLGLLLQVLPPAIRKSLEKQDTLDGLVEVVMDLGRQAEARFFDKDARLSKAEVTREDLDHVIHRVGVFTGDNRAGIERTLHRISAMRNRRDEIIGLTCRVGRAVTGTVDIIRDVIETGESILLLGPPGVGKTTLLREAARVVADHVGKRVIVVDTSNEIAGDGDVPHHGIGRARRMQVPAPELQHQVMIEAVENHMPEVIVIDEIGTMAEALAARTIAERGVQLIATAHGITLDNLLSNPTLSDLVGGVQVVTLSDEEARRRGTRKSVLERKAPPTFDVLVEIKDRSSLAVYHDIARVVDRFLAGTSLRPELRTRSADGKVNIEAAPPEPREPRRVEPRTETSPARSGVSRREAAAEDEPLRATPGVARIYPFAVSRVRLERVIKELGVPARLADQPVHADLILTLKGQRKRQPKRLQDALNDGAEFRIIKSNTSSQIRSFLIDYFGPRAAKEDPGLPGGEVAIGEAEDAIVRVQRSGEPVELSPQNSYVRRLQHELVEGHGLYSESKGKGPFRRVVIYPRE